LGWLASPVPLSVLSGRADTPARGRNSATAWDNIALGVALNTAHRGDTWPPSTSRLLAAKEGAS